MPIETVRRVSVNSGLIGVPDVARARDTKRMYKYVGTSLFCEGHGNRTSKSRG